MQASMPFSTARDVATRGNGQRFPALKPHVRRVIQRSQHQTGRQLAPNHAAASAPAGSRIGHDGSFAVRHTA